MVKLLRIILINLFVYGSLYAERITAVKIIGDESAIPLSEISSTTGSEFSREKVYMDLRRLYSTGRYSYVEAVTESTEGGIVLIYRVVKRCIIKEIKITGNSAIGKKDIKEKISTHSGELLDGYKLWQDVKSIKKLYREKDHPLVDVSWSVLSYPGRNTCTVVFNIRELKNIYVSRIIFTGNKHFSDATLLKVISTSPRGPMSWLLSTGIFDYERLKEDRNRLAEFYMDNGYIDVSVSDPIILMSPSKKFVDVVFEIREGAQYRVGNITVTGDLIFDRLDLIRNMKLKEGDIFSRKKLSMDIYSIIEKYKNVGYFFAQVTPVPVVDRKNRIVNLEIHIVKGEPVFIRYINIVGNNKTRDKVIRRQLLIREGELFNGDKLRESRERIFALGYFDEVNIRVETVEGFRNLVDIVIEVKERPTGTASAGIAYSSIDKLVGTVQLSFGNFRGMGQKLTLMAEFGAYKKNYDLSFEDPYFLDTNWGMTTSLYNTQHIYSDYTENLSGGSFGVSYQLTTYSRFYVTYSFRDVKISTSAQGALSYYTGGKNGSVTASLIYNSKNHPFDPSRGSLTRLSLEIGSRYLGGEYEFLKGIASSSYYFTPFLGITFMLHGEIGEGISLTGERLPFTERFLLGGIYTLRGYDYMTVGPRELVPYSTGSPFYYTSLVNVGGNKEILFNFEVLFPIIKEAGLKGVLFFDAGNAYAEEERFFARPLRMGYGFGFRWFSPMGPLRFEWSYPLNPREGDRSHIFEFSIGTFF